MADLRDLDIRLLVAFDAVAEEGTFGRAADRIGYTQSAVSQQIASLERLVGERVFDRPGGPRPVELTPLGAHLLDHSRALLTQLDRIADDLDRFRTGDAGRLRVGTFQSISNTVLPSLIGTMRKELPNLEIVAFESDYDEELHDRLASGELDVSFVVGEVDSSFDTRHLLNDPFRLLARPGQFPDGPVAISEIVDEPLVGQNANSCQMINEAGLRSAGLDPAYVFRTNDNSTVAAMVREGMGLAILPLLCVDPEDPRVSLHPLVPGFPGREISIAWRARHTLSTAAERFIELAVSVSADVAVRFAQLDGAPPISRRRAAR